MALDQDKGVWKSAKGKGRRTPTGRQFEDEALNEVKALLENRPRQKDLLIEFLHLIQDKYGYLTAQHLCALAEELKISMAEVYEVASFYAHFDIVKEDETPPPQITIRVCDSLSCELAGAEKLREELKKGLDLSSLLIFSSTASVFSSSIKDTILEYLPNLFLIDAVGSSETGATGVNIHTKDGKLKDSGGGPKFTKPNFSEILNLDTKEIIPSSDTETIGYLARRGHVPIAYYKDEEKSKKTFIEVNGERFSIPGDMAKYEKDGQMTLLGRGSVSINSGGEKIFPEEVEMALKAHPNIFDCLVVGVKDARWGQKVVAVIQRRENLDLSLDDIKNVASKYIASYKMPKEIVFSELIERAPSGKPNYQWAQNFANSKLDIN